MCHNQLLYYHMTDTYTDEEDIDDEAFFQAFDDEEVLDDDVPLVNLCECCGAGCLRCNFTSS